MKRGWKPWVTVDIPADVVGMDAEVARVARELNARFDRPENQVGWFPGSKREALNRAADAISASGYSACLRPDVLRLASWNS